MPILFEFREDFRSDPVESLHRLLFLYGWQDRSYYRDDFPTDFLGFELIFDNRCKKKEEIFKFFIKKKGQKRKKI